MSLATGGHAIDADTAAESDYGSDFDEHDLTVVDELVVHAGRRGFVRIPVVARAHHHEQTPAEHDMLSLGEHALAADQPDGSAAVGVTQSEAGAGSLDDAYESGTHLAGD